MNAFSSASNRGTHQSLTVSVQCTSTAPIHGVLQISDASACAVVRAYAAHNYMYTMQGLELLQVPLDKIHNVHYKSHSSPAPQVKGSIQVAVAPCIILGQSFESSASVHFPSQP